MVTPALRALRRRFPAAELIAQGRPHLESLLAGGDLFDRFLSSRDVTPAEVAAAFVPPGAEYASSLVYFRNPLHAHFESMSTFTTTGLTMAGHEPSIGRGLLFYRSFGQWIG